MDARRRSAPSAPRVKDVWSSLAEDIERGTGEHLIPRPKEKFVVVVGSERAGKSTLVSLFLTPKKDDKPKPTIGLEYTCGRRPQAVSSVKDVAHLWELGGSSTLEDLVGVPITPSRATRSMVVLVIDLSKPSSALSHLRRYLTVAHQRASDALMDAGSRSGVAVEAFRRSSMERIPVDHPDASRIDPFPVPLVVVGAKYDRTEDMNGEDRKVLLQSLRHAAHVHAAWLVCTSRSSKKSKEQYRAVMNNLVFDQPTKLEPQLDPSKPLLVPPGADSFDAIGAPPRTTVAEMATLPWTEQVKRWSAVVEQLFGPAEEDESKATEPFEAAKFMEPMVDEVRRQKDQELERYRKEVERKRRLNARQATSLVPPFKT